MPFYHHELIVAALLGAAIGLEREIRGKDPSLRTFAFICLGSCLFSLLSRSVVADNVHGDPSRIAAQIVTGIGFLGVGTIVHSPGGVTGLTTSALMWVTGAIGMAVGFGETHLAVVGTLYALLVSIGLNLVHRVVRWGRGAPFNAEEPATSRRRKASKME